MALESADLKRSQFLALQTELRTAKETIKQLEGRVANLERLLAEKDPEPDASVRILKRELLERERALSVLPPACEPPVAVSGQVSLLKGCIERLYAQCVSVGLVPSVPEELLGKFSADLEASQGSQSETISLHDEDLEEVE